MPSNQQMQGYFKPVPSGVPLAKLPLHFNMTRYNNILEDLEGINGIQIDKQFDGDGSGWKIGFSGYSGNPYSVQKAWDISYVEVAGVTTATCKNCVHQDSGITVEQSSDLDIVITDSGVGYYIGVKINVSTAVGVLVIGTTIANTVSTVLPAEDETDLYFLLYHTSRVDTDSPWFTDIDYRQQMTLPLQQ